VVRLGLLLKVPGPQALLGVSLLPATLLLSSRPRV
jgi:hypothetical protein